MIEKFKKYVERKLTENKEDYRKDAEAIENAKKEGLEIDDYRKSFYYGKGDRTENGVRYHYACEAEFGREKKYKITVTFPILPEFGPDVEKELGIEIVGMDEEGLLKYYFQENFIPGGEDKIRFSYDKNSDFAFDKSKKQIKIKMEGDYSGLSGEKQGKVLSEIMNYVEERWNNERGN